MLWQFPDGFPISNRIKISTLEIRETRAATTRSLVEKQFDLTAISPPTTFISKAR